MCYRPQRGSLYSAERLGTQKSPYRGLDRVCRLCQDSGVEGNGASRRLPSRLGSPPASSGIGSSGVGRPAWPPGNLGPSCFPRDTAQRHRSPPRVRCSHTALSRASTPYHRIPPGSGVPVEGMIDGSKTSRSIVMYTRSPSAATTRSIQSGWPLEVFGEEDTIRINGWSLGDIHAPDADLNDGATLLDASHHAGMVEPRSFVLVPQVRVGHPIGARSGPGTAPRAPPPHRC